MSESTSGWFEGFEQLHVPLPTGVTLNVRCGGRAGAPPLVLLHGFPQTHAMWHRVALQLAPHYTLVLPDLRGYGDSDAPPGLPEHANYSKRAMAGDIAALMPTLGHRRYFVCGHDRGGRVAHRLALDHADAVQRLALLDIAPTLDMYAATDMRFARAYYHWFFLIQPAPHPERMIAADAPAFVRWKLKSWADPRDGIHEPRAMADYERCFSRPEVIHGACEDYRAAAGIDLEHDRESRQSGRKIACDTLLLWGERAVVAALFDPLALWRAQCSGTVEGRAVASGHYIAEELPGETASALHAFFSG